MTTVLVPVHQTLSHRAALRLGRALTAWGARPPSMLPGYGERVAVFEASRDVAVRTLPQLPR